MAITTTTHLNFRHNARPALEFYQAVFGGEIIALTFADAHNLRSEGGVATDEEANEIMWGQVLSDSGFHVMAYDVPNAYSYDSGDKPVYVSVRGDSAEEITSYWNGLKEGATVLADLGPAPWGSPLYGMLKDKFGVTWVMDVQASY